MLKPSLGFRNESAPVSSSHEFVHTCVHVCVCVFVGNSHQKHYANGIPR